MINVSTKDIRWYDGLPIEWNGVPPDIRVVNTEAEIGQGKDSQLEYAILILH
jgi:C-terminal processing protease CtpA/Prc